MAALQDPDFRIRVGAHVRGTNTVVTPVGELDLGVRDVLHDALVNCTGNVVVDLGGVKFLDSSAIGTLVRQRNRLVAAGGSLELRAPQAWTRKVLETVGLGGWITD